MMPAPGPERIETPSGVLLRRPVVADAPGVFVVHADPRVYTLDPHETHPDVEHTRAFLRPLLDHWDRHGFGYWTVLVPGEWWPEGPAGPLDRDGGRRVAGLGGVRHHTLRDRAVLNVYVRFAVEVHGRGLGRTVLRRAVDLAAGVAPGVDVVVRTRPANAAARRMAERAGFVDEGREPGDPDMQLLRLRAAGGCDVAGPAMPTTPRRAP